MTAADVRPLTDAAPPPDAAVRVLGRSVYRGPNYWSYGPAIRLLVELGALEEWPSDRLPGFPTRLLELLPGLGDHTCSVGRPGGFVERLHEGTWLGHVIEHVALELQRVAGADVRRGKTRGAGVPGRYHVVFAYADETVGKHAGSLAVDLVNHLVHPSAGFDPPRDIDDLIRVANDVAFGPSTQALLDEAAARDIPWLRLDEESLVQLGQGVHQKRIRATMTSRTSALAVDIAGDKELTARLLGAAGLPVPGTRRVRDADEAVEVAEGLGYPVAVKPLDGNHGRGVGLDLRTADEVRAWYDMARGEARRGGVVVERFLTGDDYRLLVVGGRLVAAAQRIPAHVVGDGRSTVRRLVDAANADPRRGIGHEKVLTRIRLDDAALDVLCRQGLTPDDVPEAGRRVNLALTANMSRGGIAVDVTDIVHPDNAEIAEQAARVVGLDVAGIDIVTPDIARPVRADRGAVVEVNAAPGFRMHTHPTVGEPQYVAKPVLDLLFPPGTPSRIPIVAITGTNGKTTTTRLVAHVFAGLGRHVGVTSTDGVHVDGRLVAEGDSSGPRSARTVLKHPSVDFAVFEVARGGILREGLGYEVNDVAVVLNVTGDHLGIGGIDTIEQLADVKQVVVEAVPRGGYAVLNADDPLVARMARACRGDVVYFSADSANPIVEEHCARGGRAVTLACEAGVERVVVRDGRRTVRLVRVDAVPITYGGAARMNVQNVLAAAAASLCAGAHPHDVRTALRTFVPTYESAPGRLNLVDVAGRVVVLDYCHNAPAMRLLGDFARRLGTSTSRRIAVVAGPGDRRDRDLCELGEVVAAYFDEVVVREDRDRRGRDRGEIAALVASGARAAPRRRAEVRVVLDEADAVASALDAAGPDDVVVVCAEKPRLVWEQLREYSAAHGHPDVRLVVTQRSA